MLRSLLVPSYFLALLNRPCASNIEIFVVIYRKVHNVGTGLSGLLSLFQDERDRQVNLVAGDVAILDQHVLVLDPSTLDVPEGAGGTLDGLVNGVLEALIGGGT